VNENLIRVLKGGAAIVAEQHLAIKVACSGEISGELCRACIELNNGRVGRGSPSVRMEGRRAWVIKERGKCVKWSK
jgi:hypothetical protein